MRYLLLICADESVEVSPEESSAVPWLEEVQRRGVRRDGSRLRPVSDDLLPIYYAAAEAFIYPSLYEGFGLPLVEAMAVGTPLMTSCLSSLAEVAGSAAVFFDPRDVNDMVVGIQRVLTSPELRAELSARGLERASQFSWEGCARETAHVYEAVLSGPKGGRA